MENTSEKIDMIGTRSLYFEWSLNSRSTCLKDRN